MVWALLVRVAWLAFDGPREIAMDGADYARVAANLLHGAGYVGLYGHVEQAFPPLYPLAIAAAAALFHTSPEGAGTIVSLVSGCLLVVAVAAAARIAYGERTAVFAAFIAASTPFLIALSTTVLSDAAFLALATAGLALGLAANRWPRPATEAACGLAFGVAYLCRPEAVVLVAAFIAICAIQRLRRGLPREALRVFAVTGLAFAICIAPYAAFLSHETGRPAIEGKTAINFGIGRRVEAGQTYTAAAYGVDEALRPVGPGLTGEASPDDAPSRHPLAYARFFGANLLRHVRALAHVLLLASYGRGLLALLALVGFALGPWNAGRRRDEAQLVGFAAALYISQGSVLQYWDRYADGFLPLLALWGARACAALAEALTLRVAGAALATAFAFGLVGVAAAEHRQPRDDAERLAGTWLAAHGGAGSTVMESSDRVAYYAGARWAPLPNATPALAARYVARVHPAFVALESDAAATYPEVPVWLARGLPLTGARTVYASASGHLRVTVYRL